MKDNFNNTNYRIKKPTQSIFKTAKTIISMKDDSISCPRCLTRLKPDQAHIPITEKKEAEVPGKWCRKCDILYVGAQNANYIRHILKDNALAKGYSIDGNELWDYTNNKKKKGKEERRKKRNRILFESRLDKLAKAASAEIMICTQFSNSSYMDYIIVSDKKDADNKERFHYSSNMGRELISAAYAAERNSRGILSGKKYKVINRIYPPGSKSRQLSARIILTSLKIQPDGGYYSSITNRWLEIVDTLLYSLRTNRYEIIRATYDRISGNAHVDIKLFREYIDEYGKPNISPDFSFWSSNKTSHYLDLNTESILKGYGYSVGQEEGLSTMERRKILAEIVDLNILTVDKVVNYLNLFIRIHPNAKDMEACYRWESDKKYIQEYKVNPQRFLITNP